GLAGGVLGLLVAMAALPVLLRLASSELPDIAPIGLNWRVLVGATGISMIAGLLAGIVPAWRAARGAGLAGMRTVSPIASARASRYGTSDVFIVAQVAITLILLAGAGVLARSFIRLQHVDPGFDPEGLLVVDLQLPTDRYRTAKAIGTYAQLVTEAVGAVPGVISVAVGTGRPLEGYAVGDVQTGDAQPSPGTPLAWISAVTPEYFAALGVPVRRGSLFGADPSSGVVIDEAAARAYFPNEDDPLGRPLTFYGNRTRTVLGVVGDTREMNLHDTPPPHVYQALADDAAPGLKVLVRTAQARAHAAPIVRRVVQGIDGTVPIDRVVAMRELMSDSVGRQRYYAWLLAAFAIVALLLAASGLFGIVAYAVTQRTKEIGIRMALGADSRAVLRLIMARGIALAGAGLLIGLGVALATTQLLRSFLFEIGPRDPVALAAVALLLLVTVVAACYAPARRATAIDPLLAIRSE
ncbi:MAG TPA: FtsX-like permease family protein, partial [Gemmatimonadales bacterium]|nr:FtsX-like permease family protein [Gemmatimonadales bacterium]